MGTAVGAAGLALAAVVDSTGLLIAALALFGVGTSVVPIAGTSALFRVYPASGRAWALGVRQMAVPLGGTVAAVAMPLLVRAGGVELVFAVGAALVAVTGCVFALMPEHAPRSPGSRAPRAFRSIVRAQGMSRLLVVAAFYIVVLQAVLAFTVPAVRSAGLSALVASTAYLAINVTAMVARLVWGKIADRQEGSRRARTLFEVGLVAAAGALVFTFALHAGPVAVIAAAVVFGFGALGWNGIVYVSAGELTAPELAGRLGGSGRDGRVSDFRAVHPAARRRCLRCRLGRVLGLHRPPGARGRPDRGPATDARVRHRTLIRTRIAFCMLARCRGSFTTARRSYETPVPSRRR